MIDFIYQRPPRKTLARAILGYLFRGRYLTITMHDHEGHYVSCCCQHNLARALWFWRTYRRQGYR